MGIWGKRFRIGIEESSVVRVENIPASPRSWSELMVGEFTICDRFNGLSNPTLFSSSSYAPICHLTTPHLPFLTSVLATKLHHRLPQSILILSLYLIATANYHQLILYCSIRATNKRTHPWSPSRSMNISDNHDPTAAFVIANIQSDSRSHVLSRACGKYPTQQRNLSTCTSAPRHTRLLFLLVKEQQVSLADPMSDIWQYTPALEDKLCSLDQTSCAGNFGLAGSVKLEMMA